MLLMEVDSAVSRRLLFADNSENYVLVGKVVRNHYEFGGIDANHDQNTEVAKPSRKGLDENNEKYEILTKRNFFQTQ